METRQWLIAAGFIAALMGCGCGGGIFGLPMLISSTTGDRTADRSFATPRRPATSPSGRFLLVVVEGTDGVTPFRQWEVLTNDAAPKTLYVSPDRFRNRDTTRFAWGAGDRVWAYSGDVGTFYWESAGDEHWKKETWAPGIPNLPQPPPNLETHPAPVH